MMALDTNVLVRYIVQDDKEQAHKASALIERLSSDNQAFISCIVLCEVNWVLRSAYKISKQESAAVLKRILSVSVFDVEGTVARNFISGKFGCVIFGYSLT